MEISTMQERNQGIIGKV
ncbi:hypothetical protein F383_24760 [Gossypium arboreum]|uniref:Uncharacterized protein n=1 Tax=Gossypium arboreum TaxID=29729 RepID=A0A0B0MSY6_GOSAR|nr:hypothetical protein F383_24760 [Gossypium arboreum]